MEIRKALSQDVDAMVELVREFAEYEKLLDFFEVTRESLTEAMFGEDSFVEALVAVDGNIIGGYALFYPNFASFRGQRGFYLEDIYVSPAFRGRGVGESMIRRIASIATERGFKRIDFQVLDWNEPAVRFYEKLGAVKDDSERHFKFTDRAFNDLAA